MTQLSILFTPVNLPCLCLGNMLPEGEQQQPQQANRLSLASLSLHEDQSPSVNHAFMCSAQGRVPWPHRIISTCQTMLYQPKQSPRFPTGPHFTQREPVEDVHVRPHSVPSHSAELLRWVPLPTVGSSGLQMMGSAVSLADLVSLKLSIH